MRRSDLGKESACALGCCWWQQTLASRSLSIFRAIRLSVNGSCTNLGHLSLFHALLTELFQGANLPMIRGRHPQRIDGNRVKSMTALAVYALIRESGVLAQCAPTCPAPSATMGDRELSAISVSNSKNHFVSTRSLTRCYRKSSTTAARSHGRTLNTAQKDSLLLDTVLRASIWMRKSVFHSLACRRTPEDNEPRKN